jgi:hypothetical protein
LKKYGKNFRVVNKSGFSYGAFVRRAVTNQLKAVKFSIINTVINIVLLLLGPHGHVLHEIHKESGGCDGS